MKIVNKLIVISTISASTLLAVNPNVGSIPNVNSSIIDKQIRTLKDIPSKNKEIIDIEGSKSIDLLKDSGSNKTILVKSFKIEGNTKISTNTILEKIKKFENKELSFKQIQEVTQIITKLYRNQGYFVARAYIPVQDIQSNNILQIKILEGKYGEFKIDNKSLVDDSIVQEIFDNSKNSEVIDHKILQRAILLINDRVGVKVSKAEISPGEEIGSSNFNLETVATPRVDGYLVVDNYGSRYTGLYRTQALANINSLAKVGDKLSFSGIVSNGANLKNGRIAYELPLNSYGLAVNFAYNRTNYNLVEEYEELDAYGNSNIYEVGFSYPLILAIDEVLHTKIKYYYKDLNDYVYNSRYEDKYINSFVASLDYEKNYYIADLSSRVFGLLDFTTGNLNTTSKIQDGRYNKVDLYVSNEIFFNSIFSLDTILTAQKTLSSKNLDGNEQLSLGGAYGVKVYPYSEQSGDNGYILSNEIFATLPNIDSYSHKIGIFYDIGDVYRENPELDAEFERKRLKDIGLGYYVKYKEFFAKVQTAWTLNSQEVSSENRSHKNSRVLFQTGMVF